MDDQTALTQRNHSRSLERFDVALDDLQKDAELACISAALYAKLQDALPSTYSVIADYIRRNQEEFLK